MSELSLGTKLSYGVGQLSDGIKQSSFTTFLFFYYNQVLALSGTLAGLAVGIALVFDAITDPMVGSVSDNWRSKLGRRHPFMFLAAAPRGIAVLTSSSPLPRRLRRNKELDRTPHTDQSNCVCSIGARRRSAPRLLRIPLTRIKQNKYWKEL